MKRWDKDPKKITLTYLKAKIDAHPGNRNYACELIRQSVMSMYPHRHWYKQMRWVYNKVMA